MKTDNIEIMIDDKADEFIITDHVHLLFYKYCKINLNQGGSYIDSSDWLKSKKRNNKSHQ